MSSPQHRQKKYPYDVTDYKGESEIYGFYLSKLRRRHFLKLELCLSKVINLIIQPCFRHQKAKTVLFTFDYLYYCYCEVKNIFEIYYYGTFQISLLFYHLKVLHSPMLKINTTLLFLNLSNRSRVFLSPRMSKILGLIFTQKTSCFYRKLRGLFRYRVSQKHGNSVTNQIPSLL